MDTLPDPDIAPPVPLADDQPAADRPRLRRPFGATLRAPWARVLTTTLLVLLALAYILGRTLPGGLGGVAARLFPPAPPRVVTPTATPLIPTPAPATGPLPPPPTDCPAAPPLGSIIAQPNGFSGPVQLFGQAPVWVPQGYLPQGAAYLSQPSTSNPYPQLQIIWEIGPTEHPEVMVRVTDIRTAELAWWTNQSNLPSAPVLDFPTNSAPGVYWLGGVTNLAITHAGCYRLDVSWTSGGWSTIFAAGGGP
jgi:hypothetical protein